MTPATPALKASDMRKPLGILTCAVLLMLAASPASAQNEDISSPKLRIGWDEFKKLYDTKETVVVDVRGADAVEQGHIPGSRSIPLADVERHAEELKKLKKPVVLYCA